jgi:Ras family protein T1
VRIPSGSTTELSHKGQQFFLKLFIKFDKDRDGALCPVELGQLFSVCPSPAWGSDMENIVPTNEQVVFLN